MDNHELERKTHNTLDQYRNKQLSLKATLHALLDLKLSRASIIRLIRQRDQQE